MSERVGEHIAQRLKMRLNKAEGIRQIDQVMQQHGRVKSKPFSFKDHEYQIEIARDVHLRQAIRKCSQVGLSELMVQKILALLSAWDDIKIIYTMPTNGMAMAFSKDRFDGAILSSDYYSSQIKTSNDSASQKRMGSSMLYIGGTQGANQAISVPAEIVISDEVDFSDAIVLGKLDSRLRHAEATDEFDNRGYRWRFSTPTVEGYGIDLEFLKGDQRYYMCRCEHCEKWGLVDYLQDFMIPGYNDEILKFSREDLQNPAYEPSQAWIRCPNCHKDLLSSLFQPERRTWVAKRPDVQGFRSYQVFPWDVPKYNKPGAIIGQIDNYPLRADFMNFVIGLPFNDQENSFITDPKFMSNQCSIEQWIWGRFISTSTFGGMDVGRLCHLTVVVKVGSARHVVWKEKIRNTPDDPAFTKIIERYDAFGMRMLCIDNGPDITLVNQLVVARERIRSVVYVEKVSGTIPVKEGNNQTTINASRTKTLTLLMEAHNQGKMFYPAGDDFRIELSEHLKTTKKTARIDSDGMRVERFIRTSTTDHWVHSLNYSAIAVLACEMVLDIDQGVPPPATVGKVRIGGENKEQNRQDSLSGLFGLARGGRRR